MTNYSNLSKWMLAVACGCALPFASQAQETLLNEIGNIAPGVDAASTTGTDQLNSLLSFASGGANPSDVNYTFTFVTPGTYDEAVYDTSGGVGGDNSVPLGAGDDYLAVKYDGANGSLEVWDVAGMTGSVTVPADDSEGFGSDKYYLFTDIPGIIATAPDGGTTIALLGFALTGLGLIRRKLS